MGHGSTPSAAPHIVAEIVVSRSHPPVDICLLSMGWGWRCCVPNQHRHRNSPTVPTGD